MDPGLQVTRRSGGDADHPSGTACSPHAGSRGRLFAAGGLVGAALASSCCILPLLLVSLGIGGAWIGTLTALEPYKPYFLTATALLLAGGFLQVYGKPRRECAAGSRCATASPPAVTKAALWGGVGLAALAAAVNFWAPLFY